MVQISPIHNKYADIGIFNDHVRIGSYSVSYFYYNSSYKLFFIVEINNKRMKWKWNVWWQCVWYIKTRKDTQKINKTNDRHLNCFKKRTENNENICNIKWNNLILISKLKELYEPQRVIKASSKSQTSDAKENRFTTFPIFYRFSEDSRELLLLISFQNAFFWDSCFWYEAIKQIFSHLGIQESQTVFMAIYKIFKILLRSLKEFFLIYIF